jgi:hypothetical protein
MVKVAFQKTVKNTVIFVRKSKGRFAPKNFISKSLFMLSGVRFDVS